MKRRTGKILGLAIGQKSILIAELGGKAGAWAVHHLAEFSHPAGLDLEKPAELGAALRKFLKSQKFSTHEAIIGLPAKRLVTRRKDVPPAPAAMAASTLRLQAESEFSSEPGGLIMDFAGDTSPAEPTTVLLIAATRECIAQCEVLARAAGLKLHAITATGAALGRATSRVPGGNGVVVSLAPGGSELVVQHGESPSQIRHLNMGDGNSGDTMSLLAGEIRRSVAALPRNGSPLTLAVWNVDGGDIKENAGSAKSLLEQRLNMPIATPDLGTIVATPAPEDATSNQYAPAVALALTALEGPRLAVDFLDSRLAPPPPPTNRRTIAWGVAFAVLAVIAGWACWYDLSSEQSRLDSDKAQLKQIADLVQMAQTERDHLDTARKWAPGKPRIVACLRDITNVFPDEGSIFATAINLQPQPDGSLKGQLSGTAINEQDILHLRDRLKNAGKAFDNVANPDTRRDSSRGADEFTFSISFTYRPTE